MKSTSPQAETKFSQTNYLLREPGYLSGILLGYGLDDRLFESRQVLGIFLSTAVSRPALGPTPPPIQ
jgi:hypothetical protein